MTRLQRKLYTLSFVILFILTAPLLIMMASGYSFDWVGKVLVHNGGITIKSIPREVDIFLDGKKISDKKLNIINGNYLINGVRFGKHTVRCEKEGYTSWQKTVDVHSGVSTEFWNVILFPLNNKTLKIYSPTNVERFFLSPRNENELVLYRKNGDKLSISLLNTKSGQEKLLFETDSYIHFLPQAEENVEWSSNHKKILIPAEKSTGEKDYLILDTENEEIKPIFFSEIIKKTPLLTKNLSAEEKQKANLKKSNSAEDALSNGEAKKGKRAGQTFSGKEAVVKDKKAGKAFSPVDLIYYARWMFDNDHKLLLLTSDHRLLFVDVDEPTETLLIDEGVNGFDLAGDHLYYLKLNSGEIWDVKPGKDYRQLIAKTKFPPAIGNEIFLRMFVYDELRMTFLTPTKELFVLNKLKPYDWELIFNKIADGVKGIQFSDDGKKMLYWTNNEIWVYMLRDWDNQPRRHRNEKIFITRFLSGVNNVQWLETFENVIFTKENLIKAAELDNRDKINLVDVYQAKGEIEEHNGLYNKQTGLFYFLEDGDSQKQVRSIEVIKHSSFFGLGA